MRPLTTCPSPMSEKHQALLIACWYHLYGDSWKWQASWAGCGNLHKGLGDSSGCKHNEWQILKRSFQKLLWFYSFHFDSDLMQQLRRMLEWLKRVAAKALTYTAQNICRETWQFTDTSHPLYHRLRGFRCEKPVEATKETQSCACCKSKDWLFLFFLRY